jgi:hypothetical protein
MTLAEARPVTQAEDERREHFNRHDWGLPYLDFNYRQRHSFFQWTLPASPPHKPPKRWKRKRRKPKRLTEKAPRRAVAPVLPQWIDPMLRMKWNAAHSDYFPEPPPKELPPLDPSDWWGAAMRRMGIT